MLKAQHLDKNKGELTIATNVLCVGISGAVYDVNCKKVADDWNSLSADEKNTLFLASALSEKKAISLPDEKSYHIAVKLDSATDDKKIYFSCTTSPKYLIGKRGIPVPLANNIETVTFNITKGDNDVITFIAGDGDSWYYYDVSTETWVKTEDAARDLLDNHGYNISSLGDIKKDAWKDIVSVNRQIVFAFKITPAKDSVIKLSDITLTLNEMANWRNAMDSEVTYSYPTSKALRVKFLSDGDYIINYRNISSGEVS